MDKFNTIYSEEEMQFIRDNWESMSDEQLAEALGRPYMSVQRKRQRMRLCKHSVFNRWTTEEKKILKDNYALTPLPELKKLIPNHTIEAIKRQASELGVKRDPKFKYQKYQPDQVLEYTPYGVVTVRASTRDIDYAWINLKGGVSMQYHRWRWEREVGPIPDDHIMMCKSDDRLNCDPSNWKLISRSDQVRINHDPAKAVQTMIRNGNHPSVYLTDSYIAGILTPKDPELKEILLNDRPDIIKAARAHYKLKRKLSNYESTAS